MAFENLIESIRNIADALRPVVDLFDRANQSKTGLGAPLGGPGGGPGFIPSSGLIDLNAPAPSQRAITSGGGGSGGGGGGSSLTGVLLIPAFGEFGPARTVAQLDAECTRTTIPAIDPLDPFNTGEIIGWSCPGNLFYADPEANERGERVSGRGSGGSTGGGARTPLQILGTGESGPGIQSVFDPRRVGPGRNNLTADGEAIVGALQTNTRAVNNLAKKVDGDLGALVRSKDGF